MGKYLVLGLSAVLFWQAPTIATLPAAPLILAQSSTGNAQLDNLLREAKKYVDAKDFNNAVSTYNQAVSLAPNNSRIYSGIGYLQTLQNNWNAAVNAYRQATTLEPDNAEFAYALGYSLANNGDLAGATEAYSNAIALDPNQVEYYMGLGTVF
ncbi:MAG: tetratricopeptide repeat protein [Synechococcaceae cyanobacterium RL_1_2]|nr:tetratricopeptide repeat protein [Synechococcaceae cyanobacterium RL_1_2]